MSALVVDDNATNRRILVELLSSWGMHAIATADGFEALRAADEATRPFSLALIDMNIGGKSRAPPAPALRRPGNCAAAPIRPPAAAGQPPHTAQTPAVNRAP